MKTYAIEFRTDRGWASQEIEAASPEDALAAARQIASADDCPAFDSYLEALPVNEIAIEDEAGEEVALWQDDDLLLQLAAHDLLEAARAVIARWERGDLADAVRNLAAAVAKAEGR